MWHHVDIKGKRFNRLQVGELHSKTSNGYYWNCKFDCGNLKVARTADLNSGKIQSCGCLHKETRMGRLNHGCSTTPEYASWSGMKGRCLNPKNQVYIHYGGRGITVCERWLKFENFIADMGKKPHPLHTLDRINPSGNYEPSNCRWADKKTQANNRRCSTVTYNILIERIACLEAEVESLRLQLNQPN